MGTLGQGRVTVRPEGDGRGCFSSLLFQTKEVKNLE